MANPRWIDETEGLAPVEARYVSLVRSVDAAVGVLLNAWSAWYYQQHLGHLYQRQRCGLGVRRAAGQSERPVAWQQEQPV